MKKILLTLFISLFFSNAAFAEDLSSIIINKFFEQGQKVCTEEGYGDYLLTSNPVSYVFLKKYKSLRFYVCSP